MMNRVGGELHAANIVVIDKCGLAERTVELFESSKPRNLDDTVSNSTVLRLSIGAGDNRLLLR
jgi:hypothetical protein